MRTLKEYALLTEETINSLLPEAKTPGLGRYEIPALLVEFMRYSLMAGGKRLRPAMLMAACEMLGGKLENARVSAACLEMIHTYSLIHDDLPGMDDDTLRRGKPTNHVIFGVGQAILAGDALLNSAYELMLKDALKRHAADPAYDLTGTVRAVHAIAENAGASGMIAGQTIDLACEKGSIGSDLETLRLMQFAKTSCLFTAAVTAGAHLASANDDELAALKGFAASFGLLFQTVDDILDVKSDPVTLGKSTGKDEKSGKLTAVTFMGLKKAQKEAELLRDECLASLGMFGDRAAFFTELTNMSLSRRS